MRRSPWSRLLAAWFACWLPLVHADGGWMHACPMHAVGAAPGASSMLAMQAPVEHATHGAHGPGDRPAAHLCSCLGACCGVAPAVGAPAALTLDLATTVGRASTAAGRPAHEYLAAWAYFVLPFATPPPAGAAA